MIYQLFRYQRLFVYSKWAASPYRQLIINETNI